MSGQFEYRHPHWVDTWNGDIPDTEPWDPSEFSHAELILDACGCITGWLLPRMYAYLQRCEREEGTEATDAGYLIAILADNLGLTEHGTSINWCWLTEAGQRWLELAGPDMIGTELSQ